MSLLVDLGSTFNKTLSAGIVKMFGIAGYLKDRDGPCGWRKLTFTALSSSSTWITHATHHFSSYMHTTKPLISSNASSLSRTEIRSSLEEVDSEYAFVDMAVFVRGINEWSFLVPGIVRDS